MAIYKDSLGNTYTSLPKAPPVHKAKPSRERSMIRSAKHRQNGVTRVSSKYHRYRQNVGKPNGPGAPGAKSGKHKIRHGAGYGGVTAGVR